MFLLREVVRSWSRKARPFSTQIEPHIDPIKLRKRGGRALPSLLVQNADFLLNTWLSNNKPLKPNDWIAARKDLMASKDFEITESRVDMVIVNLCLASQKIDMAMEYLRYLWETNGEMNIAAMTHYLKCCYVRNDRELKEIEKKYICEIYDTIRNKYPILDWSVGESCISGISITERWKESIEILEMIKLSTMPRTTSYSAIISAAFDNNEPEIGWKYLREILARIYPDYRVYIKYLAYCKRNFHGTELENEIAKMLEFWSDNDIRPCSEVIDTYAKVLQELGWNAVKTSITRNGVCTSCRHHLYNLRLKDEEYATLAKIIRDRVIVGVDVYQKSNPQEYTNFLRYVDTHKPWDVVIDGLNIAYLSQGKPNGAVVIDAVKTCVNMGKKVLILGRRHMSRWPSFDMTYIKKNADIFLTENMSADDPYLLYASFSSGPATMILSRDLMRQHVFLFENIEYKRIFKYWQMANQIFPDITTSAVGKFRLLLKEPTKYLPLAQKHSNGWHVPFADDISAQPSVTFEPPRSWICLKKNKIT